MQTDKTEVARALSLDEIEAVAGATRPSEPAGTVSPPNADATSATAATARELPLRRFLSMRI